LFNRKERYWLLKNALGYNLPIDENFHKKVLSAVGLRSDKKPNDVWWAIDYHFDWIAGAIRLYGSIRSGDGVSHSIDKPESIAHANNKVVTGTQQDVDLILAFDETIILIEAKGVTGWNKKQLKNKIERFETLKYFASQKKYGLSKLEIKMLLISPGARLPKPSCYDLPHIELKLNGEIGSISVLTNKWDKWKKKRGKFLKSTLVNEYGSKKIDGGYWLIDSTFDTVARTKAKHQSDD